MALGLPDVAARCRTSVRLLVLSSLALLVGGVVAAEPGQDQEPPITLVRGEVRLENRYPILVYSWFKGAPITMENLATGQVFEGQYSDGWHFDFVDIPPGRYRLVIDELRIKTPGLFDDTEINRNIEYHAYSTVVNVQEDRPLFVDVFLRLKDSPNASWGRVYSPPMTESCRAAGVPVVRDAQRAVGELWGVVRTPDSQTASRRLSVNIEAVSELNDPWYALTQTTDTGCYGLWGLWPGRYRAVVDSPPLSQSTTSHVQAGSTQQDITLTAPPPDLGKRQRIRAGRFSRLGVDYGPDSTPDDLARAAEQMERKRPAGEPIIPDDLARLSGVVIWHYDPTDWRGHYPVPEVRLVFESERTKQQYPATTDHAGDFDIYVPQGRYRVLLVHEPFMTVHGRILALPEGHYIYEGFKTPRGSGIYPPQIPRRNGLAAQINFGLEMPLDQKTGIQSTALGGDVVNVPPRAGLDESGPLSPTFTARELDRPLLGGRARTVQSLFPLTPGVLMTESIGTLAQFTASGQRRFSNRLTIDGISADLGLDVRGPGIGIAGSESLPAFAVSGGTETLVPAGAIEEVKIRTTNAPPAYAQTPGAQIGIVTRAGGGTLAGTLFGEGRLRSLGARDPFRKASRPPMSQNFGGSVGGPLVSGLRFFGTAEGQRIDRSLRTTIEVPSLALRDSAAPSLRPLFAAFPRPNGNDVGTGLAELRHEVPITSALSVISARVDRSLSRHHVFGRVSLGRSEGTALQNAPTAFGQRPDLTYDRRESTVTRAATFGLMSAPGAGRFANDLRLGVTTHAGRSVAGPAAFGDASPLLASDLVGPEAMAEDSLLVSLNLYPGPNGTIRSGTIGDASQAHVHLSNTVTFARWRHEWRGGVDLTRTTARTNPVGTHYTFAFSPGYQIRQVTIDELLPARARFQTLSVFLQDTFRPGERLTASLGARYTVKPAPHSTNGITPALVQFEPLPVSAVPRSAGPLWQTARTLAPHVGAAYVLRATQGRSTTLRGGWGLTYDELTTPGAVAVGRGAPYVKSRAIRPSVLPVPAAELSADGPARTEYFAFPESLKPPRTYGWFASIDQELSRTHRLTLSYIGAAGRDLIYWYGYNAAGASPINVYTNAARSDYDALAVQYVRRLARGLEAQAAYTWSRSIDTDSGEQLTPHLPPALSPPDAERGPSDFDRPHVLSITGSYQLHDHWTRWRALRAILRDWRLDAAAVYRSGAPFSVTYARDFGNGNVYTVRTDEADEPDWIMDPTSADGRRLNQAAFPIPAEQRQGTRGRNALRASSLRQVDLAISRSIRIGTHVTATLRAEAFNVFGVHNYGRPQSGLLSSGFGTPFQTAAEALGTGSLSGGGLTPLQQIGGPRAFQLGLRLTW